MTKATVSTAADAVRLRRTGRDPQSRGRVPRDPNWMHVLDVCREYGISRQTVYTLCASGRLPYYTSYNGRRLFRRDEIEAIMLPYRTAPRHPVSRRIDPLGGYEGQIEEFPRGTSKQGEPRRQYEADEAPEEGDDGDRNQ